ncbi:MAG: ATP-grasp domain-containing protein [Granulosicoccus sp.]|nr:ATP-grasp domain-containing protein [Granulosicoccus sp.]
MSTILILSAGRRVSLVRGFMDAAHKSSASMRTITADMNPELSAACQISAQSFRLPHVLDEQFPSELMTLCANQNVKLVVPTIDTELPVLASLRERFAEQGVTLLVCDKHLIELCADKRKTAEFFNDNGLSTPGLYTPDKIRYPAIAKPYDGSLSVGVHLLNSAGDLTQEILSNTKNIYCEYIHPDNHDEVTVDMYYDKQHRLRCVVPRRRLEVRGGEVSKALAEKNEIVTALFDALSYIDGARGCLTLQLFRNTDTQDHIHFEINARFGGGYPLSRLAGADFQQWIIDEYLLGKEVPVFNDWADNTLMLRYDAEVLSFDYEKA